MHGEGLSGVPQPDKPSPRYAPDKPYDGRFVFSSEDFVCENTGYGGRLIPPPAPLAGGGRPRPDRGPGEVRSVLIVLDIHAGSASCCSGECAGAVRATRSAGGHSESGTQSAAARGRRRARGPDCKRGPQRAALRRAFWGVWRSPPVRRGPPVGPAAGPGAARLLSP